MRDANRGDLASLVEVSASHVQVKMKNEMVVTFIAGSFEIRQPRSGWETIHIILGRFTPDRRDRNCLRVLYYAIVY
jgi:hypothetical protein